MPERIAITCATITRTLTAAIYLKFQVKWNIIRWRMMSRVFTIMEYCIQTCPQGVRDHATKCSNIFGTFSSEMKTLIPCKWTVKFRQDIIIVVSLSSACSMVNDAMFMEWNVEKFHQVILAFMRTYFRLAAILFSRIHFISKYLT